MKSGRYFFILFLILLIMPAYAQKGVDITGTVIEEGTNEPIEQATVRLLSVKDSSMIGGVATSRNGSFMLKNIKNGSYLLHVSFVGFDPLYQPLRVTGKTNPVKLGRTTRVMRLSRYPPFRPKYSSDISLTRWPGDNGTRLLST